MNTFGRRFSTATILVLTVLQFLLCACKAEAGEISIAPQTQYLLQNVDQMATFFCQAIGFNSFWIINGLTVPALGDNSLRENGWIFTEDVREDTVFGRDNVHNMTLQIPSRIEYNNTQIQCLAVKHDEAESDPVFLIIKDVYLSINADNFSTPSQLYSVINESSTFYCDAVGVNAYWWINRSAVNDEGDSPWTDNGFIFEKNIRFSSVENNMHVHHNTLIVPTQNEFNNTIIGCATVNARHQPVISDLIKIIVMGAPSSPVPTTIFDSPGVVTLEWDTPFSWPPYPVQTYDVAASNHPELLAEMINDTRVQFSAGENQGDCEVIEFKVRASSALGDGEYGSVLSGFPIEPQLMDNSIEVTEMSSQANGKPQMSIKIKLPRVCSYQSTTYTLIIAEGTSAGKIVAMVTKGPFNGTVSSDNLTVTEGLDWGKSYQVSVIFSSEVLSDALEVLKDIYIEPPTQPELPSVGGLSTNEQTQYIIIGGAVGGITILIAVLMILIIVMVYIRRRQSMRSWSPTQNGKHSMVTNPIYDSGPVYETIPPGAPLRLHSNSESSNVTASSSVPPTPTTPLPAVPLPVESPYAYTLSRVDPAYAQPHAHSHTNFSFEETSYMIMNAVQNATESKRLSEGEESNLDGDSSNVRYVPEPWPRQPYASASMV